MTGNLINNYALFTSFARNQSLQTVILQRRDKTMDAVIAPCVSPLAGKGRFSVAKRFRCGAAVPWGARSTRLKRGGTTSCLNPAVAGRLRPPPPGRRGRLQTSPPGPTLTAPDDEALPSRETGVLHRQSIARGHGSDLDGEKPAPVVLGARTGLGGGVRELDGEAPERAVAGVHAQGPRRATKRPCRPHHPRPASSVDRCRPR